MAEKYTAKFGNKYPLRGITKRPIPPKTTGQNVEAAYTQLTKIGKASNDATVTDAAGADVPFTSNMAEVLPEIVKGFEEKKNEVPPVVDPEPTPPENPDTPSA